MLTAPSHLHDMLFVLDLSFSVVFSTFAVLQLENFVRRNKLSPFVSWNLWNSESTLKEQLDKEKAALQQSIHKNSALISEKDQQVENLKSEVIYFKLLQQITDRGRML